MKRVDNKYKRKKQRKLRVRKKIYGTPERPRLSVYKSNRHLYAQVIDDTKGYTIAQVSSLSGETAGLKPRVSDGAKLGETLGEKLKREKIDAVVFDRNGNLYHGVVQSVADGVRKTGVKV
ncbi:MAG: 50S ribosomal protein L18 [Spirochaetaceae bacterium]